ncbi:MAG: hypothetical protein OXF56_22785 [Rhodobacteraceae bacterium]|nr:hypothetical protein [Paracoccaceae bacterium]
MSEAKDLWDSVAAVRSDIQIYQNEMEMRYNTVEGRLDGLETINQEILRLLRCQSPNPPEGIDCPQPD